MAEYPQREYIVRETEYPLGCTKEEGVCELVRCKDCKHWRKYTDEQFGECMMTTRDTKVTRDDDFCSYGKKDGDHAEGAL